MVYGSVLLYMVRVYARVWWCYPWSTVVISLAGGVIVIIVAVVVVIELVHTYFFIQLITPLLYILHFTHKKFIVVVH